MAKAKKAKRDSRIVAYVRLQPEVHAWIAKLAAERGYPHTFTSVATELISKGIEVTRTPEGAIR